MDMLGYRTNSSGDTVHIVWARFLASDCSRSSNVDRETFRGFETNSELSEIDRMSSGHSTSSIPCAVNFSEVSIVAYCNPTVHRHKGRIHKLHNPTCNFL